MCGCAGVDGSNSKNENPVVNNNKLKFDKSTMRKAAIGFAIGFGVYFVYKRFIR
tara:strand:+ start:184 stop:345 length:162 start_codon:yes stop_codon:yes gene_type:complete